MNGIKKTLATVLALAILFTLFTPSLAAMGEVQALRDTAILKTASDSGEVIGTLSAGSTVEKLGTSGDYALIRYDGITGYVLYSDIVTYITVNNDGTIGGASSSDNSETADTDDVTMSALRQYSAKSGVNVRSGPGTKYSILGTLKKGELIYGATKPVSNWINVIYKGKSGYVHSSYLSATGVAYGSDVASDTGKQKDIVYTKRVTEVTSRPGGAVVFGTLLIGARCQRLGISGSYSRIICDGNAGYVPTSNLIVVNGTGAYAFSKLNRWRYAAKKDVNAYLIPVEDNSYRIGYLGKNEAVWALNGNEYWTEVYVNGRTGYVRTSDLLKSPSSGSAIASSGPYSIGKMLTITATGGAMTYAASSLSDAYIPIYEDKPYGMISKGTKVFVMRCTDKYALVIWDDDRDYTVRTGVTFATNLHSAYVRLNAVG